MHSTRMDPNIQHSIHHRLWVIDRLLQIHALSISQGSCRKRLGKLERHDWWYTGGREARGALVMEAEAKMLPRNQKPRLSLESLSD